jgi:hypothetical protein
MGVGVVPDRLRDAVERHRLARHVAGQGLDRARVVVQLVGDRGLALAAREPVRPADEPLAGVVAVARRAWIRRVGSRRRHRRRVRSCSATFHDGPYANRCDSVVQAGWDPPRPRERSPNSLEHLLDANNSIAHAFREDGYTLRQIADARRTTAHQPLTRRTRTHQNRLHLLRCKT